MTDIGYIFSALFYSILIFFASIGHMWPIYIIIVIFSFDIINVFRSLCTIAILETRSIPRTETTDTSVQRRSLFFLLHFFEIALVYLVFLHGFIFIAGIFALHMFLKFAINIVLILVLYKDKL